MKIRDKIENLRMEGKTYKEIGNILGFSKQRAHQLATRKTDPRRHKIFSRAKRASLGLPDVDLSNVGDGRNKVRELVRTRDNWTCQGCGKKWIKGQRRFDVHHLSQKLNGKSKMKGIISYDKKNMDKLITYCHKCHYNLDRTINRMRKKISPTRYLRVLKNT